MKINLIKYCLKTLCEKKINKFLLIIIFSFATYLLTGIISNSILFMPKEYKTLKKLVDKIASKNNLSKNSIPFTIGAGRYMRYEANSLGLCELVAINEKQYEEKALFFARNRLELKKIKTLLGSLNKDSLFNKKEYTKYLEKIYSKLIFY